MPKAAIPDALRDELMSIGRRLGNLTPDYQNPARFYRKRDDLADALVQLCRRD